MDAQQVAQILDKLSGFMTSTGAHVWEFSVRQQYIQGTIFAVATFAVFLASLAVVGFCFHQSRLADAEYERKNNEREYYGRQKDNSDAAAWFGVGIITAVASLFPLALCTLNLIILLNPEYAALADILSKVK